MALDDLKSTWEEMGKQVEEKQCFNPKKFNKMNKGKFNSKLQKMAIPEIIASIICVGAAVYIASQFNLLDTTEHYAQLFTFSGNYDFSYKVVWKSYQ